MNSMNSRMTRSRTRRQTSAETARHEQESVSSSSQSSNDNSRDVRDVEAPANNSSDVISNESDVEFISASDSEDSPSSNRWTWGDLSLSRPRQRLTSNATTPSSSNQPQLSVSPSLQLSRVAQILFQGQTSEPVLSNRTPERGPTGDLENHNAEIETPRRNYDSDNDGIVEVPTVSRRPIELLELDSGSDSDNEVAVVHNTFNRLSGDRARYVPGVRVDLVNQNPNVIEVDDHVEVEDVEVPNVGLERVEVPNVGLERVEDEGVIDTLLATVRSNAQAILDEEDSSEEHAEDEGPPQKIPRLDAIADEDDCCHICYEPYDNSGAHRPCCLKCGHIFGRDCIERWINAQKRCPDCNCKAMKKDIRIIYVKNLKALDTAELERMKGEVDRLKIEKNKIELANAQLRCQVTLKTQELERLRTENCTLRSLPLPLKQSSGNVQVLEPCTSTKAMEIASSSSSQFTGLQMPKLQLMRKLEIKEGQSRVGAYNEWQNLVVVSHAITSALFPGGSFGIKKINSLDMSPFRSYPLHQKPLRDMAFSLMQNELLLTVGMDKKAILFNCTSNYPVQTFPTQHALWSCCWNSVNQNIFYVGSMNGQVSSYDIRAPQTPLESLFIPTSDKSGVARLRFVPSAYQNQSFNMSGLLIQKLNSVWFCEMLGGSNSDPRYHQLPLEGPFLNVDFEAGSRHVLVSCRPKHVGSQRTGTSHVVCNLGKTYSQAEERDIFSCDIVQTMTGGFQESSIMCRSALFSPQQGQVYVAANGEGSKTVRVWDVANIEQKTLLRINQEAALDFVHGGVNETKFLGVLTDKAFDVYNVK